MSDLKADLTTATKEIERLRAKLETERALTASWIEQHDRQKARAETAEAEGDRPLRERLDDLAAAADINTLRGLREHIDKLLRDQLPGESPNNYRLRQHLHTAMTALRDAEDYARIDMPAWPTADRIRVIHEQLTKDVLNGRTSEPTEAEQLRAERDKLREAGNVLADEVEAELCDDNGCARCDLQREPVKNWRALASNTDGEGQ